MAEEILIQVKTPILDFESSDCGKFYHQHDDLETVNPGDWE